ncbi:hypothetical protein [Vreelandella venusta]|uniref:hypothetical protein n=1 Tax=Vreelandella venusta TaxID=44935 RepID=UPI00200BD272|nr:hypothetical protein [Halomonas venusta]UQI42763.1 hypothetical protein M3L73_11055 [Halomonas venusta]
MSFTIDLKARPSRWVEYEGAQFLIAIPGAEAASVFMERNRDDLKRQAYLAAGGDRGFFASNVLLDWKGVSDSKGNEVPYSHDAGWIALTKIDFMEFIQEELAKLLKEEG